MLRRCMVVVLLVMLAMAAQTDAEVPNWLTRPGTIRHALAQRDGTAVYLDAVVVDKIKADQWPGYVTIHECFEYPLRLIVLTAPDARLQMGQTVDVSGVMATLLTGDRAIVDSRIYAYLDEEGSILYHGPLIKGLSEPIYWQWKLDLTIETREAPAPAPTAPDTRPAPGPTYYQTITDAVNRARICADGDFIDLAEFQCRPILSTGTDQTYGDYFIMGEDTSQNTLKVYCQNTVTTNLRVNKVSGQLREENSVVVLCVNSGPGYDPQTYVGTLATASPNTIPFAKTLADGATTTITGQIVSADRTDFPGAMYIQEPGRNAGIRVLYTGATQVARGDQVSVIGTMGTGADQERQIDAGTSGVAYLDDPGVPGPIGMPNATLGGREFNVHTPGVNYRIRPA